MSRAGSWKWGLGELNVVVIIVLKLTYESKESKPLRESLEETTLVVRSNKHFHSHSRALNPLTA